MGAINIWTRGPDKSKLQVWLESTDANWVSGARLVDDLGNEEQWSHGQLVPGPKVKQLSVPRVYTVRVRVGFLGGTKSTVDICAQVLKPDGSVHSAPYMYTVSGKKGDIERSTLVIATLKS